jgi:hypothetical protein
VYIKHELAIFFHSLRRLGEEIRAKNISVNGFSYLDVTFKNPDFGQKKIFLTCDLFGLFFYLFFISKGIFDLEI